MRIYTKAGDLAFKTFTFPDGQPHFKLETYEREFTDVTIETAIKSPQDLFLLLLAADVLRGNGYIPALDIRYLLGARMDRAIDYGQPFTLATVARLINGAGFSRVRVLDCHSEVAIKLIRNASNIRPYAAFEQILNTLGDVIAVRPDAGAEDRTSCYMHGKGFIRCSKKRDMQTGELTGFQVDDGGRVPNGCSVIIIDDICDGGATFTGLAKVLREAGAKKVFLYVTHAILSKGPYLEGIDKIFTTDSYRSKDDRIETPGGGGKLSDFGVTVVPISMKEIK